MISQQRVGVKVRMMDSKRRVLTFDEAKRLVDIADNLCDKTYIALGYVTGHRINEVLRLKKDDFRLYSGQEMLDTFVSDGDDRAIKDIVPDNYYLIIWMTAQKTRENINRTRHPLMFDVAGTPFMKYILEYLAKVNGGRLFHRSDRTYQRRINKWCKYAGVDAFVFHGFRHTRMNRFIIKDASHFETMAWFGWKDLRAPQMYFKKSIGNVLRLMRKVK